MACSEAVLRILHHALATYGGDLDSIVVYLAVSCASVGGALRDPRAAESPPPPGPMSPHHYRPVSRRAIAASTGLPRETVRRKIAAFLERGVMVAEGGGVRIPDGLLEDPKNFEFARTMVREFVRTAAQLEALAPAGPRDPGRVVGG
jgi:hypothetical protein